jgi:hypothetical protein
MPRITSQTFKNLTATSLDLTTSAITQGTAITSGVTCNAATGVITTVSATLGTQGSASFAVTNSLVHPTSAVIANICNYAGSTGIPSLIVEDVTQGSFNMTLHNLSVTAALNGAVKGAFVVL